MPLVYWYKDKKTKAPVYYDTDDLDDEEYVEVLRLNKEMHIDNKNFLKLRDRRDDIIKSALRRMYGR